MDCENCGEKDLWRDSADVGVGIIYGPYGCHVCGWSEDESYNLLNNPEHRDKDGYLIDQYGGLYPASKIIGVIDNE